MQYWQDFLSLGLISLLGAISPGPDFIVVTQQSLRYGKQSGIFTSLGVACGCLVHITYCVFGIGILIAESVIAFNIIKYLGAIYLMYLGWQALRSKITSEIQPLSTNVAETISSFASFKKGLLVNLLNPKVTLFILSVFTQMIDPKTPYPIQALLGLEFSAIAFLWFTFLTFILTHPILRKRLLAVQGYIEKALGVVLIALGLRVANFSF